MTRGVIGIRGQGARRQVTIGGRRVRVIDIHAHCVIPVQDIVKGTPLDEACGGGGGNNCSARSGCRSWISRASTSRR